MDLVHDTELVAGTDEEALSELIKASLEHGTSRAVTGSASMPLVHGALGVLTRATTFYIKRRTMRVVARDPALLERVFATTTETIVASTAWDWIGAPLSAIWCNISLGRDLDVGMGTIIKVNRRILVRERKSVALEALLIELRILWAETVAVATSMLCTHAPTNFSGATSLPISSSGCLKYLRTLRTSTVALWDLDVWLRGVCEATGNTAGIHHWCFAWGTPRVVLGEITALRLAMRIPSTELWVVVGWLNQSLLLSAVRSWVEILALQGACRTSDVATNLIPVARITKTTVVTSRAGIGGGRTVCVAWPWL